MKKNPLMLLFSLWFAGISIAQDVNIDKQKIREGRAKPDSVFVDYLTDIASAYAGDMFKTDSAEVLYTEGIALAEKIGYAKGFQFGRLNISQYYFQKGKLTLALNTLLKNEASAIQSGDSSLLFSTLRITASVYMHIGDLNMARKTLGRRQAIIDKQGIKNLNDSSYEVLSQYNSMAVYYNLQQVNKSDSAGYYFRKIHTLGQNTASAGLWAQLGNGGLANYFSAKGLYDSAIYHAKIATAAALKAKRFDNYYGFILAMANTYKKSGQLDSAFKYAYMVYTDASRFSFISLLARSSGLLATLYKDEHKYDSTIKYMAIESQYKDTLSGQETLKNIQMLTTEQEFKVIEQQREKEEAVKQYKATIKNYFFIGGLLLLLIIILFMYRVNKQRTQSKREIENAYNDLKATQAQLVQSEKMASLGELTAGIAHEIQNPLNFVNNFSDVNSELVDEAKSELDKGNVDEAKAILNDIKANEQRINHHGKRADVIVKGMLQHSRNSSGQKEPTNINALADEYLRLAYHGLRAKDKSFNVTLKTLYDENIGNINIIPQDIGRVILNLINNAFYTVDEKKKAAQPPPTNGGVPYEPTVSVSTKKLNGKVEIKVSDNGYGIPPAIADKIFQPFFTTKPTGQGTGLGLSLAYDIIKAHGGGLKADTKESEGTTFIIQLPGETP
jgi:signal transduction histidine kinase